MGRGSGNVEVKGKVSQADTEDRRIDTYAANESTKQKRKIFQERLLTRSVVDGAVPHGWRGKSVIFLTLLSTVSGSLFSQNDGLVCLTKVRSLETSRAVLFFK